MPRRNSYIEDYENAKYDWITQKIHKQAEELKTEVDYKNGVATWKKSGNHLPIDLAEFAHYLGLPVDLNKHQKSYDEDTEKVLAEYRKRNANRKYSAEELYEMRAAFGEGAEVVDVITGRKIKL